MTTLAKRDPTRPKLLFLDEVNAGLNSGENEGVLGMIRRIAAAGMSIVIIEHLMEVVYGLCPRLIVLHQGRLLASGPKRLDINMYTDGHTVADAIRLPPNLLDALRSLEKSLVLKGAFGETFISSYVKLKTGQWNSYSRHLTDWERQTTLDC